MENSCMEPKNGIVSEKLEASCFPCKGAPELGFPCPPLSSGVPITTCTVPWLATGPGSWCPCRPLHGTLSMGTPSALPGLALSMVVFSFFCSLITSSQALLFKKQERYLQFCCCFSNKACKPRVPGFQDEGCFLLAVVSWALHPCGSSLLLLVLPFTSSLISMLCWILLWGFQNPFSLVTPFWSSAGYDIDPLPLQPDGQCTTHPGHNTFKHLSSLSSLLGWPIKSS